MKIDLILGIEGSFPIEPFVIKCVCEQFLVDQRFGSL